LYQTVHYLPLLSNPHFTSPYSVLRYLPCQADGDGKAAFHSFKAVLRQLEESGELNDYDPVELFSFHSVSKGVLGECGRRGGYVECANVHPLAMAQLYKVGSIKHVNQSRLCFCQSLHYLCFVCGRRGGYHKRTPACYGAAVQGRFNHAGRSFQSLLCITHVAFVNIFFALLVFGTNLHFTLLYVTLTRC
jgi:hypothetical protein